MDDVRLMGKYYEVQDNYFMTLFRSKDLGEAVAHANGLSHIFVNGGRSFNGEPAMWLVEVDYSPTGKVSRSLTVGNVA